MSKLFSGTVGLIALVAVTPSFAADVPVPAYTKAPVMIAAVYDWGGFYLGVNAGGGWSRNCSDLTAFVFLGRTVTVPATPEGCNNASGALAGGQFGYRIQNGGFVFGLEALGDWAGLTGSNMSLTAATVTNQTKVNGLGVFTAQAGYTLNNVLFYLNGGAAVTANKYSGSIGTTAFDQASETRVGAAAGTGIEYGFAPNWSAAVEYDHLFMGSRANTFGSANPLIAGAFTRTDTIRQDLDLVTARINYRWGGPGISKY